MSSPIIDRRTPHFRRSSDRELRRMNRELRELLGSLQTLVQDMRNRLAQYEQAHNGGSGDDKCDKLSRFQERVNRTIPEAVERARQLLGLDDEAESGEREGRIQEYIDWSTPGIVKPTRANIDDPTHPEDSRDP